MNDNNNDNKRRFLGVWFECCGTYGRLYKTKDGTMYKGRCPKCLRIAQARVGGDGTDRRFFRGS